MRKRFAALFCSLFLYACASLPENAIVGRWSAVDGSGDTVFSRNGAITAIEKNKSELVIGSYEFVAENKLSLNSNGKDPDFKSTVVTVAISNNEMTMTSPQGKSEKYRRRTQ